MVHSPTTRSLKNIISWAPFQSRQLPSDQVFLFLNFIYPSAFNVRTTTSIWDPDNLIEDMIVSYNSTRLIVEHVILKFKVASIQDYRSVYKQWTRGWSLVQNAGKTNLTASRNHCLLQSHISTCDVAFNVQLSHKIISAARKSLNLESISHSSKWINQTMSIRYRVTRKNRFTKMTVWWIMCKKQNTHISTLSTHIPHG